MGSTIHHPIFFENIHNLDGLSADERNRVLSEMLKDCNILYEIWGRIMHYSTNIEHMLREHLDHENEVVMLGRLITEFCSDTNTQNYPQLILDLNDLKEKCRNLWAHGTLTYAFEGGKLIKYLINRQRDQRGIETIEKIEIDNDYFDNIANILFPKVLEGLFKMWDTENPDGTRHLRTKTSFILPVQKDNRVWDFIFVK